MARPFVVHVAKLRRAIGTRWREERRGPVAGLDCSGSAVPEGADVEADVVLESVLGGVSVTGAVRAPWSGTCRRCLATASGVLEVPVRELFTEGSDGDETYSLDADEVDLEPMVRDTVLLELPVAPLCRPDCKGLCPGCGTDQNAQRCRCEAPPDPRWAALDALCAPRGGDRLDVAGGRGSTPPGGAASPGGAGGAAARGGGGAR